MDYTTSRAEYDVALQQFMLGEFVFDVGSLYAHLEQLTDQRDARGVRYPLADVLALIILAKLGGEDSALGIAEWLKHRAQELARVLKLPRVSMPHAVTISRILGKGVVVEELEHLLHHYFEQHGQASHAVVVAIDGKTIRGTIEVGQNQGVQLLAAYLPEEGLVLMQVEVGDKENEIVAAPRLLQVLDLRGKVVVGDAMHTQRALSIAIVRAGGAYIWTAKGNQAEVQATIARLFEPEEVRPGFAPTPTDFRTVTQCNKGHGRLERRTLTSSSMLKDYLDWPYVEQVFKLERHFVGVKSGQVTTQVTYGLTSLSRAEASPQRLLHSLRTYWGIENGLHYRRDVTFGEDRCRLRIGCAARVMATLNNLVVTLLTRRGFSNLPAARRRFAAHAQEALAIIMQPL
jgi:predicted transposase YbfD/YdcC